jgi:hypothetical protein
MMLGQQGIFGASYCPSPDGPSFLNTAGSSGSQAVFSKLQLSLTIHQQTLKPLMLLTLTIKGTRPVLDRSSNIIQEQR